MDFRFETVESCAECGLNGRRRGHNLGEFGPEQAGIGSGEEQRDAQAIGCELVAMAVRNALDDAVEAEPAKVVGQFSGGIVGWIEAQQLRQQDAHFRIGEPAKLKTEDDQYGEQSLDARIIEPQSRDSLTVDLGWPDYPIKSVLPNRAIVRNLLDVEKTPVGLEADLTQGRQVL